MSYVAVNAGELIHLGTFAVATDSEDGNKASITTWSTVGQTSHWAKVEPMSGSEYRYGDKVAADCDTQITVRANSDTTARTVKDRFVVGSKTYAIKSIVNVENRGIMLVMACKELIL